jgi:hypothetical protein
VIHQETTNHIVAIAKSFTDQPIRCQQQAGIFDRAASKH